MLIDFLTGMEFDLFVPSFPELKDYFHLSPFLLELSLSVNFIGYCMSLFISGELADRYGRKSIILLGLLTFIVGSVFCLSTNSYFIFLIGRFLQGLGIAAPSILSFLVIADLYPVKKQQLYINLMPEAKARLTALMQGGRLIFASIGLQIAAYFYDGSFHNVGIIVASIVLMAIITMFFVMKRWGIIKNATR